MNVFSFKNFFCGFFCYAIFISQIIGFTSKEKNTIGNSVVDQILVMDN